MSELQSIKKTAYPSGEEVEAQLETLRQGNRLCIHQWEMQADRTVPRLLPATTLLNLARPYKEVREWYGPFYSTTLLPGGQGRSVLPYDIASQQHPACGYLFNLEQKESDAANVVRVFSKNLNTGEKTYQKKLKREEEDSDLPEMNRFYRSFATDKALRDAVRDPANAATQRQLDALGSYLRSPKHEEGKGSLGEDEKKTNPVLMHNEVLAHLRTDHLAAICIPVFERTGSLAPVWAAYELHAALAGLAHLDEGIDRPVVFYHVTAGPQQGQCSYFGQGRDMLEQKAHEAITAIQNMPAVRSRTKLAQLGLEANAPEPVREYSEFKKDMDSLIDLDPHHGWLWSWAGAMEPFVEERFGITKFYRHPEDRKALSTIRGATIEYQPHRDTQRTP